MLHLEHHTIVLCASYAAQPGEDLDDVHERLASAVALTPGVVGVDGLTDDLPLDDLQRRIERHVKAAFRRGVSSTLASLCGAEPHGSRAKTIPARAASTLAHTGHLAFTHRDGIRTTPQLLVVGPSWPDFSTSSSAWTSPTPNSAPDTTWPRSTSRSTTSDGRRPSPHDRPTRTRRTHAPPLRQEGLHHQEAPP
jgi:hypothetical protein